MPLSEPVEAVAQELYRVSKRAAITDDVSVHAVSSFLPIGLQPILDALKLPFPEPQTPAASESDPHDFVTQAKDFVVFSGVQKCFDKILVETTFSQSNSLGDMENVKNSESISEKSESAPGISESASEVLESAAENSQSAAENSQSAPENSKFAHLFACLDLVLCELAPAYEIIKRQFFLVLETIGDQLLRKNPVWVASFWQYLETRAELLKNHVFSSSNTANRIAVLGFCNHVTDLYYERNSSGKYDSYGKDSFNDKFHARVRVFLAKLLDFEDSTGLNKYFATANRVCHVPTFEESGANSGDDQLLDDLLRLQKVLRNPYALLKKPGDLAVQVESISKLNSYFLSEEVKYARIHPTRDIYKVQAQSAANPGLKWFFPEFYWMSAFEDELGTKGSEAKEPSLSDKHFGLANLDSSKYRKLVVVQIYLLCTFLISLSASKKKDLLGRIGSKANTKHITDDCVPEHIAVKLSKVKSDTLKSVRGWDSQLNFFLLSIAQSEENWLGWLVYGKNKDGSGPLLVSHKNISESELASAQQKYDTVFKFKTKRYFNSHVTPQLSRRMKTKTGLEGLVVPNLSHDYGNQMQDLVQKIENETNEEEKVQLNEERLILLWKSVKGFRNVKWLEINDVLNMDDFGEKEVIDKKENTGGECEKEFGEESEREFEKGEFAKGESEKEFEKGKSEKESEKTKSEKTKFEKEFENTKFEKEIEKTKSEKEFEKEKSEKEFEKGEFKEEKSQNESDKNSQNESDKNSQNESDKKSQNESDKNSQNESDKNSKALENEPEINDSQALNVQSEESPQKIEIISEKNTASNLPDKAATDSQESQSLKRKASDSESEPKKVQKIESS